MRGSDQEERESYHDDSVSHREKFSERITYVDLIQPHGAASTWNYGRHLISSDHGDVSASRARTLQGNFPSDAVNPGSFGCALLRGHVRRRGHRLIEILQGRRVL